MSRLYRSGRGFPTRAMSTNVKMDQLVSLCKRRGFVFQSSDIYGGFNGFYDYGPLGVELKRNITQSWWREFVHARQDISSVDSSIISSPLVWEASGHVGGFSDPMVDCRTTRHRFRADQLYFAEVETADSESLGFVCVQEQDDLQKAVSDAARSLLKRLKRSKGTELKEFDVRELTTANEAELALIPSPSSLVPGDLTPPRSFNLMFQTKVGAMEDSSSGAYLRPETAQGIFVNFKHIQKGSRMKVPFGIAQVGKAFRNEITPRNFLFRSREFEQMEIEYFVKSEEWEQHFHSWVQAMEAWLRSIGMNMDMVRRDVHEDGKLAHYAKACTDLTFQFPFGRQELLGIAARGTFDLTQHMKASGKNLEYFDETTKEHYIPDVIEPSCGVDRIFLALITSAYAEDEVAGESRTFLKLHPSVAPIKAGVFPLMKNKPELVSKAQEITAMLQRRYNVFYDVTGAIGRRYRRMDEVGTPFCVTVDFESLEDNCVTVRDRDSTDQVRMPIDGLSGYLSQQIEGF